MKQVSIMLVAGEASSDQLAAQLAVALRHELGPRCGFAPIFFGAGGAKMAEAGVELSLDLVRHAMIGIPSPQQVSKFTGFRDNLLRMALDRCPDVFVGVDSFAFNGSLAAKIHEAAGKRQGRFHNWRPRIVQFVSPQVWASRPGRAKRLERHHDLLLSILPFEKTWYAKHAPKLRVEFVGNPLVDRFAGIDVRSNRAREMPGQLPLVLFLAGSRRSELKRHWPILVEAARLIRSQVPVRFRAVLPNEAMRSTLENLFPSGRDAGLDIERVVGGLSDSLQEATVTLASTGTVTVECAWFGVPTVALYRTNWTTYQIGRRIVTVPFLAMPNLLAGRAVMPEFVQDDATPANVAQAALRFLKDRQRWAQNREELLAVAGTLGEPGACERAARAISGLL
ncbi:MAG TPA: lipid-A-disaccharide synthase [Candidatus Limnocylindria bacterium]|nr:lipid-A-disaccharide synthase [Candidatus Limnocylindria bacterium]